MKSKFKLELYSTSDSMDMLVKLIGRHNAGEIKITLKDIQHFLLMYSHLYTYTHQSLGYLSEDGNTLNISRDGGKTITMSIVYCEYYELNEETSDSPKDGGNYYEVAI